MDPTVISSKNKPLACQLVPLRVEDLPQVARTHVAGFTDSALTHLGTASVKRYYHWLMTGPHQCTAVGVWEQGRLAGFCYGGVFDASLGGFLKRNRLHLLGRLVLRPWLLANPVIRERMRFGYATLRRMARRKSALPSAPSASASEAKTPSFKVLSITVDPHYRGCGIGRMLMLEMERTARAQGYPLMELSVHTDNDTAIRFYEGLGWRKVVPKDQWHGLMSKSLV